MILFTTGRGTPIGFPRVPVIKIASTTAMFRNMEDDMDVNAGAILEGKSLEELGQDVQQCILDVLNGKKVKAEINLQGGILCMYCQTTAF